ncbi:lipocalin-like domain-containing protein [uncultured Marinobacter sp.]|uniref:lipocalin-like domain-containing protein n=1 Tax=uncultured Marinobacter sp. TaxID=187379 RepID=UPI0030DAA218
MMSRTFALVVSLISGLPVLSGCSDDPATAAGFAGLAETVDESAYDVSFLQPAPGDQLTFPDDWGEHPRHRIEWWYLTANLKTLAGEPLGLQWTQFRQALVPRRPEQTPDPQGWPLESVWMAHGALSVGSEHHFSERFARGDIGHAGATADPFAVWLDHWQLKEDGRDQWQLSVQENGWGYELILEPSGTLIAHGDRGFSAKSASGEGSMYFSDTDIRISGEVRIGDRVEQVEGTGWLDREWSSQFLRADQQGWDWFALRLDSGARLMAFRLREEQGDYLSGTWITPDGTTIALSPGDLDISPEDIRSTALGDVPVQWRIEVKPVDVTLVARAPAGQYWNDGLYPYWESPVAVSGSETGEGYMELTGYRR